MLTNENSELFSGLSLEDALLTQARKIKGTVYSIASDEFRRRPNESLIEGVVKTLDIEQLVLHFDQRNTDTEMIMLSRSEPGYRVTISVPYTGERRLWFFKPQDHGPLFPAGQIHAVGHLTGGILRLIAQRSSNLDIDPINQAIEEELGGIKHFVGQQRKEIRAWRIQLAVNTRQEVLERREALGEAPEGPPAIEPIQPIEVIDRSDHSEKTIQDGETAVRDGGEQPGAVAPSSEPGSKIALEPSKRVRAVDKALVQQLSPIEIIQKQAMIFGVLPQIYAGHSDEEHRDILLAHLVHSTAESATANAFQAAGKTNLVLMGANGASLSPFVVGCLTWKGPAALMKSCDHLLERSGGKDPMLVLVVLFRRTGDFDRVLNKVPNTLEKHPRFKHEITTDGDGEWTFVMSSPADGESERTVRAIAVNLPSVQE